MAPTIMECEWDGCKYVTKEYEPAIAMEQLKLHAQAKHTQATGGSTAEDRRNRVKFPKPTVDQGQSLEEWETFLIQWAEYKRQMRVETGDVPGQLISCGSKELQTSLTRVLGKGLYKETEGVLLLEMKNLAVKFQNPAVYVEEF